MAVAGSAAPGTAPGRWRLPIVDLRSLFIFLAATGAILLLRAPSFFEPPWHTDEGIFAAVAQRVLSGGDLYADAWESKPPLFLYLYVVIFKLLGVGVLQLRIAATLSALATQWALYAVGCRMMSRRQALIASLIFGALMGVPFWEGTLALTETFAVLPSTLAVVCVLAWDRQRESGGTSWRWLGVAGLLFGLAFLLRQTAAVVAVATCLWLLLSGRPWFKPSLVMAASSAVLVLPVVGIFYLLGTFEWFWDANVGFFFQYVPSGTQIPFHYRPLIVLPVFVALAAIYWQRRRGTAPVWSLPALWLVLTLAAALLTGRPYSHYFMQTFPPLALLIAQMLPGVRLSWRPSRRQVPALALAFSLAALWFGVVTPEFHGNVLAMRYTKKTEYYANFAGWATGIKDRHRYNLYFDRRVYQTEQLEATFAKLRAGGEKAYIWGEYPWLYALADLKPSDRYMTSFYVLLIPYLDTQLGRTLAAEDPRYVIVMSDARTRLADTSPVVARRYAIASLGLQALLERRYAHIDTVGRAQIYERVPERTALPRSIVRGYEYVEPEPQ